MSTLQDGASPQPTRCRTSSHDLEMFELYDDCGTINPSLASPRERTTFEYITSKLWIMQPKENECTSEEIIFCTRMMIVVKNPSIFRLYISCATKSGMLTNHGVAPIFYHFIQNLRLVEILDDIRRAATKRLSRRQNSGSTFFLPFGWETAKSEPSLLQQQSPNCSSPRIRHRHCKTVRKGDCDDHSVISAGSNGLSLPSLAETAEAADDHSDDSSVGSDANTAFGWDLHQPPSPLRSN